MTVQTDSERVRTNQKMVLEFLESSVDMTLAAPEVHGWMERYGADPGRYGEPARMQPGPASITRARTPRPRRSPSQ